MSIASLNALVLTLTEEKSSLEFQRMLLDTRRTILSSRGADIQTDRNAALTSYYKKLQQDKDDGSTSVEAFNDMMFQVEFDEAQARLDAIDKQMQMERTNLDTKLEAITTSLENVQKQLNKNEETEFKGIQ